MGHVKSIDVLNGLIKSKVQGDDIYPHNVEIEIDSNGKPESLYCSCPMNGICIHLGAVLLHYSRKIKKPVNIIDKNPEKISSNKSTDTEFKTIRVKPEPLIELDIQKKYLNINLFFKYKNKKLSHHSGDDLIFIKPENISEKSTLAIKRDLSCEVEINRFLKELFVKYINKSRIDKVNNDSGRNDFVLKINMSDFISLYGKDLDRRGINIRLRGRKNNISHDRGLVSFRLNQRGGWFDLETLYVTENGKKQKIEIDQKYLNRGVVRVGDDFSIISNDEIKKIKRLSNDGMNDDGKLTLSRMNFELIDYLYDNIQNKNNKEINRIKKLNDKLRKTGTIDDCELPEKFNGELRNYQKAGYNWLNFLKNNDLNGCLADDMGLGKTVQTLAFLQHLKERDGFSTSVIVLPVITIANWENEIERFVPELKFLRHGGNARIKDDKYLKKFDIILVSYQTLRNDIELFSNIEFNYIILDEAHYIKNSSSQVFKAVKTLRSRHRLSLTGTPVENNTGELWSQMEFLNPGHLGSKENFKLNFTIPIEADGNRNVSDRLKKMIYPFILRRKKEDVLKDLPPREDIRIYTEMGMEQRNVYETYRRLYRDNIKKTIKEKGVGNASMDIFNAILKLRQISLFPSIVNSEFDDIDSCKFEAMKDMIDEIISEDHKILVFSQFVSSLKNIKNYFDEKNIEYAYIDGSTQKRENEIKRFNDNKNVKIFLLSLKAGGVGINLTSADYVFLFDPWWNTAVENQAIDRCYRIGQKRKVTAYRMIVKDSVEEKILKIQEKKKILVEELITEENGYIKTLSASDIIDLFE